MKKRLNLLTTTIIFLSTYPVHNALGIGFFSPYDPSTIRYSGGHETGSETGGTSTSRSAGSSTPERTPGCYRKETVDELKYGFRQEFEKKSKREQVAALDAAEDALLDKMHAVSSNTNKDRSSAQTTTYARRVLELIRKLQAEPTLPDEIPQNVISALESFENQTIAAGKFDKTAEAAEREDLNLKLRHYFDRLNVAWHLSRDANYSEKFQIKLEGKDFGTNKDGFKRGAQFVAYKQNTVQQLQEGLKETLDCIAKFEAEGASNKLLTDAHLVKKMYVNALRDKMLQDFGSHRDLLARALAEPNLKNSPLVQEVLAAIQKDEKLRKSISESKAKYAGLWTPREVDALTQLEALAKIPSSVPSTTVADLLRANDYEHPESGNLSSLFGNDREALKDFAGVARAFGNELLAEKAEAAAAGAPTRVATTNTSTTTTPAAGTSSTPVGDNPIQWLANAIDKEIKGLETSPSTTSTDNGGEQDLEGGPVRSQPTRSPSGVTFRPDGEANLPGEPSNPMAVQFRPDGELFDSPQGPSEETAPSAPPSATNRSRLGVAGLGSRLNGKINSGAIQGADGLVDADRSSAMAAAAGAGAGPGVVLNPTSKRNTVGQPGPNEPLYIDGVALQQIRGPAGEMSTGGGKVAKYYRVPGGNGDRAIRVDANGVQQAVIGGAGNNRYLRRGLKWGKLADGSWGEISDGTSTSR